MLYDFFIHFMKYLLLRSNERVQETIDGVIKFSIEKKKKKKMRIKIRQKRRV